MIPDEVTDDAFLGGKLHLLQPKKGFRSGLDAVLLAAAARAPAISPRHVLDAGAGVGAVGLAIAVGCPDARITLVEIDPALAKLARRNAERNNLSNRVDVVVADLSAGGRAVHDSVRPQGLAPGMFDRIVVNPPYFATGSGTPPALRSRAGAHQMAEGSLDRWIAFLATAAAADATLTMIHRADALTEVLSAIHGRFGRIRLLPVQPRIDAAATRIIVAATKGSRAPLEIKPSLVVHDVEGRFLPALDRILRHGDALKI
ncbi:MAG: tRNA1(Val) (adenine(37)-N6)-methyltransferase [Hyphomicrobiaceae bacterium]